jgi:exosortase
MSSRVWLGWIIPALLWLWLFFHLHYEWMLNSRYNYGWGVPFLALVLFYLRWPHRPEPKGKTSSTGGIIASCLILLGLLPLRVIEEANPEWRLLSWTLALAVVAFSLLALGRAGGRRWAAHFAFPVCFPLVAVPWPVPLENTIVQAMTRAVAYVAVEIAGWSGIGAYQAGNIIQLRNGFVGVDEACSGVKTLQAGIMVALVLGELLRLRPSRRWALIFLGCGWIFACNVFRATALVIVAATQGLAALERWHDLIGTAALLCGMAGLLSLAWWWKEEPQRAGEQQRKAGASHFSPVGISLALAWLVAVFGLTELWYRSHEKQLVERPRWEARWPAANETLRKLPIPETTREILHYDAATSAVWEEPRDVQWWSFFARWKPARAALQLVRSHSPEICLPAIGRTFRGELPRVSTHAGSVPLDFRTYEFEQNGRPLFVFVCIQEDKTASSPSMTHEQEWNLRGRLRAAWLGQRNLGQRLLEIAVTGFNDFPQAREATERIVSGIVQVDEPTR